MKTKAEEALKEKQNYLSKKGHLLQALEVAKDQVAEASVLFSSCLLSSLTLLTVINTTGSGSGRDGGAE